jgi:hypothetical protein
VRFFEKRVPRRHANGVHDYSPAPPGVTVLAVFQTRERVDGIVCACGGDCTRDPHVPCAQPLPYSSVRAIPIAIDNGNVSEDRGAFSITLTRCLR